MTGCDRMNRIGRYFKEQVRQALVEQFGWERVYRGGLKVYTTIDLDMQTGGRAPGREEPGRNRTRGARARAAPAQRGRDARAAPGWPAASGRTRRHGSVTGQVRAMVGGRNFEQSHFNRADAGQAATGLRIQAVRFRGGNGSRLHTGVAHRAPRRARHDAAGRVDAGGRALRRPTR